MGTLTLSTSNVGQTSVTINWNVTGMVSGDYAWDVFVYGGGGTISQQGLSYSQASASNSASVTGLTAGTTYTFLADLNTQNGAVGYQTKSITVTTSSAPATYTGSWNLGGGSGGGPYPTSVTVGGSISAPTSNPTLSGYNFSGWSVSFPYTPTGSGWVINANWTAIPTYPPSTLSGTLGSGQVNVAYSASVTTTNMPSYSGTWSSAGTLPPGLSLSNTAGSNTNTLSGTPTTAGTYNFSITATNSYGSTTSNYSVVIAAPSTFPPAWSDNTLAGFVVNKAYSDGVTATNMASYSGVYSYTGSLPAGISLNTSTGAVTGTPTAPGPYSFTLTATNTYSSVSQAFSGSVAGGMAYYDGSAWTKKVAKVYNGTSWVAGTVYVYDGSSWVAST